MESVTNIIVDVANEVCDKLCKYPGEYEKKYGDSDEGMDKLIEEKCEKCVLNKLI